MKVFASAGSKKKRRSGSPSLLPAARRIAAGCLTLFLAWAVFLPGASGAMGTSIHDSLAQALGGARYLIPLLAVYGLCWRWRSEGSAGMLTLLFGSALLLVSSSTFLGEAGSLFDKASWGGLLGGAAASFLRSAVGRAGSFLLSGGGWVLGAQLLFGLSPVKVLASALRLIVEDYRGWQKGRRELKELLGAAQRGAPAETGGMAPAPAPAKSDKPAAPPAILGAGNGAVPAPAD
ncbi:MAG: DNA translocase FtsK 4TM domain-containing protein, partial [Elusimicrobiota bacterium]